MTLDELRLVMYLRATELIHLLTEKLAEATSEERIREMNTLILRAQDELWGK